MSSGEDSNQSSPSVVDDLEAWTDVNSINVLPNQGGPYIEIIEQPQERGHRFRYACEGKSHGVIKGERSDGKNRTFPSIQIQGYQGPARIRVSLATDSGLPHDHELTGQKCNNRGEYEIGKHIDNNPIQFKDLSILHVTQKAAKAKRIELGLESADQKPNKQKKGDKNAKRVRLKFTAVVKINGSQRQLNPVLSNVIYDGKGTDTSELKIRRLSKYKCSSAGHEEVFLLCDKVNKDDIQVRFYEINAKGQLVWEGFGEFGHEDVHYQVVIVFKTPRYFDGNIGAEKSVMVQLKRPSDGALSDAVDFRLEPYVNTDLESVKSKRKKPMPPIATDPIGSMPSTRGGRGRGGRGRATANRKPAAASAATNGTTASTSFVTAMTTVPAMQTVMTSSQIPMTTQQQQINVMTSQAIASQHAQQNLAAQQALLFPNTVQTQTTPNQGSFTALLQGTPPQPQPPNRAVAKEFLVANHDAKGSPQSPPNNAPSPMSSQGSPAQYVEMQPAAETVVVVPGQTYEIGGFTFLAGEDGDLVEIGQLVASSPELQQAIDSVTNSPAHPGAEEVYDPMNGFMIQSGASTSHTQMETMTATSNIPSAVADAADIDIDFSDEFGDVEYDDIKAFHGPRSLKGIHGPVIKPGIEDIEMPMPYEMKIKQEIDADDNIRDGQGIKSHTPIEKDIKQEPDDSDLNKHYTGKEQCHSVLDSGFLDSGLGSIQTSLRARGGLVPVVDEELTKDCSVIAAPRAVAELKAQQLSVKETPDTTTTMNTQSTIRPQKASPDTKVQNQPTTTATKETKAPDAPATNAEKQSDLTMTKPEKCSTRDFSKATLVPSGVISDASLQLALKWQKGLGFFAQSGDIRYLLALQRHLIDVPDGAGDNAIHLSVIHRQLEPLRHLLNVNDTIHNVEAVNARNDKLQTPLHLAVITNEDYMVELLMDHGARLEITNANGYTALHLACKLGYHRCIQSMLTKSKDDAVLRLALQQFDREGYAALHHAVQSGNQRSVEHLVSAGADVNIRDGKCGYTPLHHAVGRELSNIVGYLLMDRNIQPNVPGYNDVTPLHEAVSRGNLGISAALMAAGADPEAESAEPLENWIDDEKDKDTTETEEVDEDEIKYLTPLHIAQGNQKMIRILRGERYNDIRGKDAPISTDTAVLSTILQATSQLSIETDTIDTLDIVTKKRLAQLLDQPQEGADWMALAALFNLTDIVEFLKTTTSPASNLIDNLEAMETTVFTLQQKLALLKRQDAVTVIQEALHITQRARQEHMRKTEESLEE